MSRAEKISRDAKIFRRDNFTCQYCGYRGDTFEKWRYLSVDHFKAKCRGGNDSDDNLITACMDCNFMKCDTDFATLEEAKAQIAQWVKGEHADYERFFAQ
jgi:5-methylcytosine-specific restriction endonuclease McrA